MPKNRPIRMMQMAVNIKIGTKRIISKVEIVRDVKRTRYFFENVLFKWLNNNIPMAIQKLQHA